MRSQMQRRNEPGCEIGRLAAAKPVQCFEAAAGQALVEFALVFMFILVLLFGAIDMGWMAYLKVVATNAARAGAQYGAQNQATAADTSGMRAVARNDAPNLSSLNATPSRFCECAAAPGDHVVCSASPWPCASQSDRLVMYVQVSTQVPYTAWVRFPGVPQSATMQSLAVMRVSR
jgi:Flp pilus assembly protein TadG